MAENSSIADSDNPIEEVIADDAREANRGRYGWLSLIVAALFGLFYAYDVWSAVSNLVALPAVYDAVGIGASNVPWWLLWVGILIPLAVFIVAFAVGRRRTVFGKALVFLLGLAVTAGLGIGVLALEEVLRPEIVSVVGQG